MKYKKLKTVALLLIVILTLGGCLDRTLAESTPSSNPPAQQESELPTLSLYKEHTPASELENYSISDFITEKGKSKGNNDPNVKAAPEQLSNSNWYRAPSITAYLARLHATPFYQRSGTDIRLEDGTSMVSEEAAAEEPVAPDAAQDVKSEAPVPDSDTPEHSTTNVQIEGVDEADIIKTDGKYIYYLNKTHGIAVVKAGETPLQVATIVPETGEDSYPLEYKDLYISGEQLVVVTNSYHSGLFSEITDTSLGATPSTAFFIYNISSPENPTLERNIEISGSMNTTRFFNNTIYFVTNQDYVAEDSYESVLSLLPAYKDSLIGKDTYTLTPNKIYQLVHKYRMTTMFTMVGSFGLDDTVVSFNAYEGDNISVFMNQDSLYLANGYRDIYLTYDETTEFCKTATTGLAVHTLENSRNFARDTYLNRFEITDNGIAFSSMGIAKGSLINQYAMDEYQGVFRVATTDHSASAVTLFDNGKMEMIGQLDNIAPRESIKSVRFTGVTGYVVTFRETDPLFIINLRNPQQPILEGELKIPGFSTYLHPISDSLVIGLGVGDYGEYEQQKMRDELERTRETMTPQEYAESEKLLADDWFVYGATTGVKVSMFDVSNPHMPREIHKLLLGNEDAFSEALYNPKAIMFDQRKNIMAFPLTYPVADTANSGSTSNWRGGVVLEYGQEGFSHKADFTLDDYYGDGTRFVYIDETLYYVCEKALVAIDYNTYEIIAEMPFVF